MALGVLNTIGNETMARCHSEPTSEHSRVGVNSAPELDFLANSGIGIELELALPSPGALLVHIDSTKEIRGQLCNCSHNNETVGSYQPFHDQVGHGLTITGQ